jgi:phospholipid/cholesterol/gamma-HCH transport system substrate-binding protein
MRFAIKFADKIVGFFIILAIIGLLGVVIVLGANQRWFSKNFYFYTIFQSAKGISRGMPITFKGFEVGKVASIDMNENNEVIVHYYIYDTYYPKVRINSVIELASSPLGSSLLFYPGKSQSSPLEENSAIPSIDSELGKSITSFKLAELPEKSEDTISSILKNVDEFTSSLNLLIQNNAEQLDKMVKSLSGITASLNSALNGEGYGPVGELFNELAKITKNLEGLTADVNGLIPKLLDPTGKEIYPAILTTIQNIQATSAELKRFAEFIGGTAPQITGILQQGQEALNKGKDVLEGLSNNPLISGGITKQREQPSTFKSFRDEAF